MLYIRVRSFLGHLRLGVDVVLHEFTPQIFELCNKFTDIKFVICDHHVLLVVLDSLESPVEGASNQYLLVDDAEFMVHVVSLRAVSPARNALVSQSLGVSTLSLHGLVIRNYSYIHTLFEF